MTGNQAERGCADPSQHSGGDSERDPPVPIPNTEVKPFSADGTWLETARESRTLPDSTKSLAFAGLFLFAYSSVEETFSELENAGIACETIRPDDLPHRSGWAAA